MKKSSSLKKFVAASVLLGAGLLASGQAMAGMWVGNGGLIRNIDVRDGFLKINLENSHLIRITVPEEMVERLHDTS